MVAVPIVWILFLNIIKLSLIGTSIDVVILFGLWKSNQILRLEKKNAFAISLVIPTIMWLPLLYQIIRRINFIIENGGMERADGYGSPLAFLIGFVAELYLFIPISVILLAAVVYYSKSNKTEEPIKNPQADS